MDRKLFAERLTAGLAGWFQQLGAQGLEDEVGEDAARVELIRMISAQRAFLPKRSQRPVNWPAGKKHRIDIAILGRSMGAKGWHGAVEVKWPRKEIDYSQVRLQMVQDAVRVAFTNTTNTNAKFLVVGGSDAALECLFDKFHPLAAGKETQRVALTELFSRDLHKPQGYLTNGTLLSQFPAALQRIDDSVTGDWNRRLRAELLSAAEARIGDAVVGRVYAWQCRK